MDFRLFYELFLNYFFKKNHNFSGSCDYERLGHEEAHDAPKKEEPPATNIFSNPREAAKQAVSWDIHEAPWEVSTAL